MASTANILLAPFPGETLSVPYLGYEPVNLLIQRAKNLLNAKYLIGGETIYFNGIGIRNEKATIDDCKVYGNVISMNFKYMSAPPKRRQRPGKNSINILVKTLMGQQYQLSMHESSTVEDLKWRIKKDLRLSCDLRLIFNYKQLEKGCLVDNGIAGGAVIHAITRLRGGGGPPRFADIENGYQERIVLSDDAPIARTVCEGTNIEAECQCTPDYRVICMQGHGLYELGKDVLRCPMCRSRNVKPITVGFNNCEYRTHGIRTNGSQYSSDWIRIENEDYNLFDSSYQCEWIRLIIQSRPLKKTYDSELCVICLKALGNRFTTKKCKHRFHRKCISKWHGECPTCQASHW
ncbi:hypothetical protein O0I10_011160 [Lichtheimia ornata]|uniref:Uncharacterized protein n=1 Tax=Lichtheimia ornata TaxID=688661 RepID=A0AAD7XX15_9FUNG|nr:uncharacterized protein O0I10_011160 [Lichtheimia ornata]KAJ8653212.1 hypothetical protein O0I10_011160 [Lichtheimia ornata]